MPTTRNPYSARTVRLDRRIDSQQRFTSRYGLTTVRAIRTAAAGVHLAFETGVGDMATLCGAMETRELETIDEASHCADCAYVARGLGLEDYLKDDNGWTDLYCPRPRG